MNPEEREQRRADLEWELLVLEERLARHEAADTG